MLFYHFNVHMSCQIWATKLEVLLPVNAWPPSLKQSWKMAFFTKKQQRFPSPEDLVIVTRYNTKICQYAIEMQLPNGQRSTVWVKRLPEVVANLNNKVT